MRVPLGVVTVTGPVVVPFGTLVVISVSETTLNFAGVPLKLTIVVPVRLFPKMITFAPNLPELGMVSTNGASPRERLKTVPQKTILSMPGQRRGPPFGGCPVQIPVRALYQAGNGRAVRLPRPGIVVGDNPVYDARIRIFFSTAPLPDYIFAFPSPCGILRFGCSRRRRQSKYLPGPNNFNFGRLFHLY